MDGLTHTKQLLNLLCIVYFLTKAVVHVGILIPLVRRLQRKFQISAIFFSKKLI